MLDELLIPILGPLVHLDIRDHAHAPHTHAQRHTRATPRHHTRLPMPTTPLPTRATHRTTPPATRPHRTTAHTLCRTATLPRAHTLRAHATCAHTLPAFAPHGTTPHHTAHTHHTRSTTPHAPHAPHHYALPHTPRAQHTHLVTPRCAHTPPPPQPLPSRYMPSITSMYCWNGRTVRCCTVPHNKAFKQPPRCALYSGGVWLWRRCRTCHQPLIIT